MGKRIQRRPQRPKWYHPLIACFVIGLSGVLEDTLAAGRSSLLQARFAQVIMLGGLVGGLIILFFHFRRRYVWHKFSRQASGYCPRCGYDLTGNMSGRCPECGTDTRAGPSVP
jgi:hypothetical protein